MKRLILTTTSLIALAVALAGCTPSGTSGQASSAAGAVTTQEPSSQQAPSNPGTGIIKNTTMTSCDTKEGKVTAAGNVTLPQDVKGNIKVSVSWIDPKTSAVLAQATQTIKDAPTGKATDWTVATDLGKTTAEVHCVLGATVLPAS